MEFKATNFQFLYKMFCMDYELWTKSQFSVPMRDFMNIEYQISFIDALVIIDPAVCIVSLGGGFNNGNEKSSIYLCS